MDSNDVESVKQVLPEASALYQLLQILVGGGNDAHVDLDRCMATHPVELTVGKHPQQARLCLGWHIADFIEKQRTAVCLLKSSVSHTVGAREGAFLVAEKFRFHQVSRDGGHIQGDERRMSAWAVAVQRASDQFLAGSGFAVDKNRNMGLRQPADGAENLLHCRRFTDDFRRRRQVRGIGLNACLPRLCQGPLRNGDDLFDIKGLG